MAISVDGRSTVRLDEGQGNDPLVVDLGERVARATALTGAKAASLARAHGAGLPVLEGLVMTTAGTTRLRQHGPNDPAVAEALCRLWTTSTTGGRHPVAVRSSSVAEDGTETAMAGHFTTVLDVIGWEDFLDAVHSVVDSAATAPRTEGGPQPMAVLVQPMVDATVSGVLFGVDPLSGRTDRMLVEVVEGTADALVSGEVAGSRTQLTRRGRAVEQDGPDLLGRRHRRGLARLARDLRSLFGSAQDVEWAVDGAGRLRLLQSRPVTSTAARRPVRGPRFGPGPVAETFPLPLRRLEADLWIPPLAEGLRHAITITGAASSRRRRQSPVVREVGGWVVADLDLLGAAPAGRGAWFRRFDPRPPGRRLRAAWRVGRLKAAFADLARDTIATADAALTGSGDVDDLSGVELATALQRTQTALRSLHGYEALAGLLSDGPHEGGTTGSALALALLADGRRRGLADADIVAASPAVLALVPPRLSDPLDLPPTPGVAPMVLDGGDELGVLREALRLRIRWIHELQRVVVAAAAARLAEAGRLDGDVAVVDLTLDDVVRTLRGHRLGATLVSSAITEAAPVPALFRFDVEDRPVAEVVRSGGSVGAGGGRGEGPVWVADDGPPPARHVLVTRTLDPRLAASLEGLAGLVAETGSVLSHLAITARELGVPTVVGVAGALDRYPPGTRLVVDGDAGTVEVSSKEDR